MIYPSWNVRTDETHRLQAQHVDIFRKTGGHDMVPMELGSDVETEKRTVKFMGRSHVFSHV